ncbi:hypothetical protein BXZ70DRAFT_903957 [Cristinia sonorae]|uniref:Uncharacterized protein n=1 Tax=Cristinia sonorae TaxID=1940300 RepID=A0A8K0XTE7_9AGAR|nr:hypothetical protein BXZ70DRAFT_903957 [Cristinia sonorae]
MTQMTEVVMNYHDSRVFTIHLLCSSFAFKTKGLKRRRQRLVHSTSLRDTSCTDNNLKVKLELNYQYHQRLNRFQVVISRLCQRDLDPPGGVTKRYILCIPNLDPNGHIGTTVAQLRLPKPQILTANNVDCIVPPKSGYKHPSTVCKPWRTSSFPDKFINITFPIATVQLPLLLPSKPDMCKRMDFCSALAAALSDTSTHLTPYHDEEVMDYAQAGSAHAMSDREMGIGWSWDLHDKLLEDMVPRVARIGAKRLKSLSRDWRHMRHIVTSYAPSVPPPSRLSYYLSGTGVIRTLVGLRVGRMLCAFMTLEEGNTFEMYAAMSAGEEMTGTVTGRIVCWRGQVAYYEKPLFIMIEREILDSLGPVHDLKFETSYGAIHLAKIPGTHALKILESLGDQLRSVLFVSMWVPKVPERDSGLRFSQGQAWTWFRLKSLKFEDNIEGRASSYRQDEYGQSHLHSLDQRLNERLEVNYKQGTEGNGEAMSPAVYNQIMFTILRR